MKSYIGGSPFGYKSMFMILHEAPSFFCADLHKFWDCVCKWCKDFQYKMWWKWILWFLIYQTTKEHSFLITVSKE